MPLIEEEEFIKLCSELEELKEKEEDLKKGYINLKIENTKINNYKKYKNIIIIALFSLIIVMSFYLLKEENVLNTVLEQNTRFEVLIDSIKKDKKEILELEIQEDKEHKIIFAVQIGVFKKNEITLNNSKLKRGEIRRVPNATGNIEKYIVGEFYGYQQARIFREEIKKIGIKDAFIVAFYKGKKVSINKAMKLLNN